MDELAKRFADLAEKYGPNVADAALSAARIEAYSAMAGGAMALAIAAALAYAARFFWNVAGKDGWDDDWIIATFILGFLALIPTGIGLWAFIDPWTWTTINHPELWLAKKAFHI